MSNPNNNNSALPSSFIKNNQSLYNGSSESQIIIGPSYKHLEVPIGRQLSIKHMPGGVELGANRSSGT